MISRVHTFIQAHQLILPGDTILAAVSGGIDSMVMLDILYRLQNELSFSLRAVHVHHGIRGREADEDRDLVQNVCAQKRIPFISEKLSGFDRGSSEEVLRDARYALFENWLKETTGAKIATGHHLDDRLETFFMRLAKGSGVKGLRSIPVRRGAFIRPLLFLTGKEIAAYAAARKIAYRTDSSNTDESKLRNKIRMRLTPVLLDVFGQEFYRGFADSLRDLEEVYALYEEESRALFARIVQKNETGLRFEIDGYRKLAAKQRRQLLEYCISHFYPLNFGIPKTYFSAFDKFVFEARTGAVFHFEREIRAYKQRGHIVIGEAVGEPFRPLQLTGPQSSAENRLFKISIHKLHTRPATLVSANRLVETLCGDRLRFPLQVRGWRRGDWFIPLGMNKKQKLSDFFINRKIDRLEKKKVPLLTNGDEIVWVAGYRLDNRYRVRDDCQALYRVEVEFKI